MKEVTRTKEYTEHKGKIHFNNGDTEEITFDGLKKNESGVTLQDYMKTRKGDVKKRVVRFIPHNNLRDIETTERVTEEIEYTEEVRESSHNCRYCGERRATIESLEHHERTCSYRPSVRSTVGRID